MAERGAGLRGAGIRWRTTVAATSVVAAALAVGAVVLVLALRSSLTDAAAETAEQRVEEIVQTLRAGDVSELPSAATEDRDDVPDVVWQVLRGDGAVASSPLGGGGARLDPDVDTVVLDGDRYVIEAEREGEFVIVAAATLDGTDDAVGALLPLLAIGLPGAVVMIAVITWLATGRALRPVERIREQVDSVTASDLGRRVDVPPSDDEISRLARTMNTMLGRLEASAQRQRRFLSDTSHELRSPLASLRQTAEVARRHPGALGPEELADAVLEEGRRMQDLVEQMLVLTRTEEQLTRDGSDVDLDDLLADEAYRVRRERPDLDVRTDGIGAARVHGDAAALARVVRNLVDNAARHAGHRIELACSEISGARVQVSVDDDGPGVPAEERERVFERFVRLDDARSRDAGGSGLGLAIVREVARAHGGDAVVTEAAGGGASFRVQLPTGGHGLS